MISINALISLIIWLLIVPYNDAITSPIQPFINYQYSTELQNNIADLWWTVNETRQDIVFELHIKTTGWIALGISPAGGMRGADIGLGWIDQAGRMHFQDRYASTTAQPLQDNTTTDWFGLQGREENGWTAIQFMRALSTCDTMDVVIKSGTNILIFAYGLEDPDMSKPEGIISYHEKRRGSRIIPLRSYGNPSPENTFADLDSFDFRSNEYVVPSSETTYHCKIYKVPPKILGKRHAIAHKTIIGEGNRDLVHHLLMYECDPAMIFDDNNLPDDVCDKIRGAIRPCMMNIATGWAVGGDEIVEFPEIGGYPVGGDTDVKYYMIQIHYDNPTQTPNRTDSSGIRFYLGKELRQYDLGYLTVGTDASVVALAIPPRVERFIVDSYCPAAATSRLPESGITVLSAFPHTHLQGRSVWTKIIRNRTAVDYLFNADTFDFNYQYENRLVKPIQLYPGDELATRCIYSTTNKAEITLGGEATKEEMCLHTFIYYPRLKNVSTCLTEQTKQVWMDMMNSSTYSYGALERWLLALTWTPESSKQWQEFYDNAPRMVFFGRSNSQMQELLPKLPDYEDLKPPECRRIIINSACHQKPLMLLVFIFIFLTTFLTK